MANPNAPRGAMSLQNVLKYTVQYTDQNAEQKPNEEADDVEKNQFLESVLSAMTTDASQALKAALVILNNEEATADDKLKSLDVIRSHIDDIDNANSLVKMGGATTLRRYVKQSENEIRVSALNTVAEMAQNNPFCQNAFIIEKFLPVLSKNLGEANEDIVKSSLYAISSLIRNFQPGYVEFKLINGINSLVPCLKSSNSNVYIKAAFLIAALSREKHIRDDFVKAEIFPVILENLKPIKEFDVKQETTLFALSSLSLDSELKLSTEKRKEILSILQKIISKNKQTENCEDIVNYARNIVDNLNAR